MKKLLKLIQDPDIETIYIVLGYSGSMADFLINLLDEEFHQPLSHEWAGMRHVLVTYNGTTKLMIFTFEWNLKRDNIDPKNCFFCKTECPK